MKFLSKHIIRTIRKFSNNFGKKIKKKTD